MTSRTEINIAHAVNQMRASWSFSKDIEDEINHASQMSEQSAVYSLNRMFDVAITTSGGRTQIGIINKVPNKFGIELINVTDDGISLDTLEMTSDHIGALSHSDFAELEQTIKTYRTYRIAVYRTIKEMILKNKGGSQ